MNYFEIIKMTTYSHSRLGTFQQCKYKYKLNYIDKVKTDLESIEAFMGKLVHETLEKLYKDLKFQKLNKKEDLIKFFENLWNEKYHDNILIVKKDYKANNYKKMGKKYIEDYYDHYKPFNDKTIIDVETQNRIDLSDGNQYHIRIDKLSCDKEGNYYVCDFKTNNSLKAQGELDEDKQLAMYSLWVKDKYKDAKSVKLVWYFLAFDKEMISERNDEQLNELKKEIEDLIKEVEKCEKFPTNVSGLCDYCGYVKICPAWKHKFEVIEEKKKFKDDEGGVLVDEFSKLTDIKKEAELKIGEVRGNLIEFAKQKKVDVVFGSKKKCSVKEFEKIVMPEDREGFIELLKKKGLYDENSMVCYPKLNSKVLKGDISKIVISNVDVVKDFRLSLKKRKDL